MEVTFAGLFGAIAGSFLNVVAYRLPRKQSLISPGSRCPHCRTNPDDIDDIAEDHLADALRYGLSRNGNRSRVVDIWGL